MSRSLKLYCDDILTSCDKILRYTNGLDYDSFNLKVNFSKLFLIFFPIINYESNKYTS